MSSLRVTGLEIVKQINIHLVFSNFIQDIANGYVGDLIEEVV